MRSLEHRTNLVFDLSFGFIIMPLLIIFGPAHYWWTVSPIFTTLTISYLYGCYFIAKHLKLPNLILSGAYKRLAVISAIFIIPTYLLTLYPLPEVDFIIPSMSEYQTHMRDYNMSISLWFMFSVVIGYSLTVAFIKELYNRMLLQSILESQRDKAQLAMFKAQINPHFLFNTLNSLYSLVIGTSKKAEDAFVRFTELLKYTYITADNDWVTILDEINYIDNYVDLEMIRLDNHTCVARDFFIDDYSVSIPPMIFLTFIENAFKYGVSTSHNCKILIRISLKCGILIFETQNQIIRHTDEFRKDMPIGISNCKSRLSALFPDKHTLLINEENEIFRVYLKIDLNRNE